MSLFALSNHVTKGGQPHGSIRRSINTARDRIARDVFKGRSRRNLSRRELAERVGTSEKTISRVENRQTTPRPVVLDRLDEVIGE